MANIVQELKVRLGLDNEKVLAELKSNLRGIASVAKVSGQDLLKVADAVKSYSNNGKESIAVIRGQVSALKGLQDQAKIGGKAFRELGKDVAKYEANLKSAEQAAQNLRVGTRRRGTALKRNDPGGFVANVTDIQARARKDPAPMFNEAGALTEEYIKQQSRLALNLEARERMEARVEARVRSVTKAQSDNRNQIRTASQMLETFGGELAKLPPTTNNLQLELKELGSDLGNLVIGGEDYIRVLGLINQKQKQLDNADPFGTDVRKRQIRSRLGKQQPLGMLPFDVPVQKSIERNRRKRARRYGGFTGGGLANQPVEASSLFQTIASIGSAETKAATEMMGRSLSQVTAEIKRQAAASNGNVNSLNAQKIAFDQLRAGLDPTSQDFRELGKEIEKVDRKLGKLNKKKFSAKGAAQTVGAVASAGIFGGAAGAAGALAAAPFGPGAAVVGGGIGTSVGIAAQKISSFTDYAASIRLSEKALKRLVETEHNNKVATDAIDFAVKRLNVEREAATLGMTRLSAAVLGANGTIEQAALAFLGTTVAIKATKGGVEDVRGGITALVQMFSKGRISAEELSGQLGERFPAAVTAFAEANNRSTAELQKRLKLGKVGLDELVEFLAFVTKKYTKGALEMAASAEESGQRQQRAFEDVRKELGDQLIDVGAKLQEGIAESLITLTPIIVNTAKAVAGVIETLVNGLVIVIKNFRNLIDVVTVVAGGLVLGKLLTLLGKLTVAMGAKGFAFSVQLLSRFIRFKLVTSIGLLITKLRALALVLAKNPITAIALGFTALGVSMFRASQQHKDFIDDITNGVMSLDDAGKRVDKYKKRLETLQEINSIIKKDPSAEAGLGIGSRTSRSNLPSESSNIGKVAALTRSLQGGDLPPLDLGTAQGLTKSIKDSAARITSGNLAIQSRTSTEDFDTEANMLKALEEKLLLALQGGDSGGTGKEDISDAMMEARINGMRQVITLADVEAKLANDLLQISLKDLKANEEIAEKAQAHFNAEQSRLGIEQQLQTLQENITAQLDKARLATGEITQEQFDQKELERRRLELKRELLPLLLAEKKTQEEIAEIIEAIVNGMKAGQNKSKSFVDGLKELIEEATDLNKTLAEFGVQAVDKFANTFADFVATGKASFSEFANSVLADLARIFARAAFFQALEAVFPGLGKTAKIATSANGNVLAKNKIVPYAYGGIVNKPTLFPMANGAGLMGEAGPEAIMPLRRGANGKLGVEASGSGVGDVVVNVDAAGSSVEGDGNQAAQLGKAIGIAVQQELVKQKRPGGLLSR